MNNQERIEDFVDGIISADELNQLKDDMEHDTELVESFELSQEVNNAIKDKALHDLMDKMDQQKNQHIPSPVQGSFQHELIKTWHLAAASFALILVVGGLWYILSNKPYSTEKLVSKYYKPAHPILQVRSIEVNADDTFKEAFQLYQQNDFKNALKYFNSLNNQITAKFYAGICYIELEQFNEAITSFEFVVNDNDNLFIEQAEWYIGLIYLMNNQKAQALSQFEKISGSDSYYSERAKEILKYLN